MSTAKQITTLCKCAKKLRGVNGAVQIIGKNGCLLCKGTGKQKTCPTCEGAGMLPGSQVCDGCSGRGKVAA